jgi:hypothetical protein
LRGRGDGDEKGGEQGLGTHFDGKTEEEWENELDDGESRRGERWARLSHLNPPGSRPGLERDMAFVPTLQPAEVDPGILRTGRDCGAGRKG